MTTRRRTPPAHTALWRRLDTPGHDACRLAPTADGWSLDGMAVFRGPHGPTQVAYYVSCDPGWRTLRASLLGWSASGAIEHEIHRRPDGAWHLDDVPVPGLEDVVDVDLDFTPATNLLPLRRLGLDPSAAAATPAAHFDLAAGVLRRLEQRYERLDGAHWRYAAPEFAFATTLAVDDAGFVRDYPGLWHAESAQGA